MKTKSNKWQLIWLDIKSWLVTNALVFTPIVAGLVLQWLTNIELGLFKEAILVAVGSFFKLIQKWIQTNTYK